MTMSQSVNLTAILAPSFYALHHDVIAGRHTYYKLDGGRGSCKSSFVGTEIPYGMMRDAREGKLTNAVIFRRYKENLRDSVYEQLLWGISQLGVEHLWRATTSPLRLTYLPTGQVILFRGADKVKKAKSIKVARGYIKYLWFEELDEFENMEKIRSVQQSVVRGGEEFTVFYSYNPPPSLRSWVNDPVNWARPELVSHHSTYQSVPPAWLGAQFIADAEFLRETNETVWRHEYLGEITGTGAEVFANLRAKDISAEQIAQFDRVYSGLDWGYYPDPFAWNRMHYDAARRTLYVYDELTLYKAGNEESARRLQEDKGVTGAELITADSAEPKSIADYRSYGLYCRGVVKGPGSVQYRMKWLQSLSAIVIDPKRCPDTWKEFSGYEYDRDREGALVGDYPDRDNHHIDAVSYGMFPVWKKRGQ